MHTGGLEAVTTLYLSGTNRQRIRSKRELQAVGMPQHGLGSAIMVEDQWHPQIKRTHSSTRARDKEREREREGDNERDNECDGGSFMLREALDASFSGLPFGRAEGFAFDHPWGTTQCLLKPARRTQGMFFSVAPLRQLQVAQLPSCPDQLLSFWQLKRSPVKGTACTFSSEMVRSTSSACRARAGPKKKRKKDRKQKQKNNNFQEVQKDEGLSRDEGLCFDV